MLRIRVAKNIENTTLSLASNFDYFRGSASFQPRQFLITLALYQPQGLHKPFTRGKPQKLRDFKAKPQNTLNQKLVTNPQTRTQIFRGSPNFSKCSIGTKFTFRRPTPKSIPVYNPDKTQMLVDPE